MLVRFLPASRNEILHAWVFREALRVLKQVGHFAVSGVAVRGEVPVEVRRRRFRPSRFLMRHIVGLFAKCGVLLRCNWFRVGRILSSSIQLTIGTWFTSPVRHRRSTAGDECAVKCCLSAAFTKLTPMAGYRGKTHLQTRMGRTCRLRWKRIRTGTPERRASLRGWPFLPPIARA